MTDVGFDARMRDTIGVDLPYNTWIADAYELCMPTTRRTGTTITSGVPSKVAAHAGNGSV
jgi:hypothetical protein